MWDADSTRAIGLLSYEQRVEAFRLTDRLSESGGTFLWVRLRSDL
jgi:hypothetical protein